MIENILLISCAVFVYITAVFGIALWKKRLDIVDIAWGGAFIVVALTSFVESPNPGLLQMLVTGMVIVWGIRLGYTILRRVMSSPAEDPRYTELRSQWKGSLAFNAYVRIFLVQGFLATVVSASVILVNLSDMSTLSWITAIGLAIWLIGFFFESVGDAQLKKHLANPNKKGQLMTSGLWKYTRHPNYFGEATQWWGIWIIALAVPFGWVGVMSPLLITVLLLLVSGVPLTEKRFAGREGWNEYRKRTSVFIPLPPEKA
jgi:steroid 5-alpha reductase family enzyme